MKSHDPLIKYSNFNISNHSMSFKSCDLTFEYTFGVVNHLVIKFGQLPSLKITVGHQIMSKQNQKLSDQTKNTPDILFDRKI